MDKIGSAGTHMETMEKSTGVNELGLKKNRIHFIYVSLFILY